MQNDLLTSDKFLLACGVWGTVKTEIIETGARTLELPPLVRSVVSAES